MDKQLTKIIYIILAVTALAILTYFIMDLIDTSTLNIAYELKLLIIVVMISITIIGFYEFVKSMDERPVQLGH